MFSICFMLILIKEFETEQTVRSRRPYKCEISKLFYLPQTPPVNSFKLIPASERLLTPTETLRKSGSAILQIFAFILAPGAGVVGSRDVHWPQPRPGCLSTCPGSHHLLPLAGRIVDLLLGKTAPRIGEQLLEPGCTP